MNQKTHFLIVMSNSIISRGRKKSNNVAWREYEYIGQKLNSYWTDFERWYMREI